MRIMKSHSVKQVLMAAGVAIAVGACAGTAKQESTGEYIDDTTITTKVKSEFVTDGKVAATRISVETYKGVVQLSGFANSSDERSRAVQIARNVRGVKSVKDDIVVR